MCAAPWGWTPCPASRAAGLTYVVVQVYNDEVPAGFVISQSPCADSKTPAPATPSRSSSVAVPASRAHSTSSEYPHRCRYHLLTLGCPKNVADSSELERSLREAGQSPAPARQAGILIVNTCAFIDAAKEESINAILKLALKKKSGQKLVVIGCLPQLYRKELLAEIPEIDHVFGVESWEKVAALAESRTTARRSPLPGRRPGSAPTSRSPTAATPAAASASSPGSRAGCTACRRTPSSTKASAWPRKERESSCSSRRTAPPTAATSACATAWPFCWSDWRRTCPTSPGCASCTPTPATSRSDCCARWRSLPQVCKYLDIPLQHSSPAVLRRMRRPHDSSQTRRMLERLREAMPDIALRTTFLVGFPGETEQEFQELLAFVREAKFDHVGAFTFSPQAATPAARMPDQVPERVKRRRYRELMRVGEGDVAGAQPRLGRAGR